MAKQSDPLRAAVIGCGPIGRLHAATLARSPDVSLRAVCDVDIGRARQCGQPYGVEICSDYRKLLGDEELDFVTVATPNHLHVSPVEAALECGLDVFCEKPLATELAASRRLAAMARAKQRSLSVNYNRRFGFGYRTAGQWIEAGRIGALRRISFLISDKIPPPHVAIEPAVMLTSLLVHYFDLSRVFGGEVERVSCLATPPRENLIRNFTIDLFLAGGVLASIQADYREGQIRTSELAVFSGDTGEIRVPDVTRSASLFGQNPDEQTIHFPPHFRSGDGFNETIMTHLDEFVAALSHQRPPPVSAEDGVEGLRIGEAARKSLIERRIVELAEIGELF